MEGHDQNFFLRFAPDRCPPLSNSFRRHWLYMVICAGVPEFLVTPEGIGHSPSCTPAPRTPPHGEAPSQSPPGHPPQGALYPLLSYFNSVPNASQCGLLTCSPARHMFLNIALLRIVIAEFDFMDILDYCISLSQRYYVPCWLSAFLSILLIDDI